MVCCLILCLGVLPACSEEDTPDDPASDTTQDVHDEDVQEAPDAVSGEEDVTTPDEDTHIDAPDVVEDVEVELDTTSTADSGNTGDTSPPLDTEEGKETMMSIPIGLEACCLSVSDEMAVWSEAGNLMYAALDGSEADLLVEEEGEQTQPAVSGDRVVWADNRNGDFDLYMMSLSTGETSLIVSGPGDQRSPSLDGDHLAWVDLRKAPHTAAEAEIYFLDLSDPEGEPLQVTDDNAEQDHVFIQGNRMVWSDYSSDPDGVYLDINDPNENNADIIGYDIETAAIFVVTDHPSKQLRPAIDGDAVIWLDWRGIQPEPKYSEFGLYTTFLGVESVEQKIAVSAWNAPDLWVRPLIHDGVAAWIAEDYGEEGTTRLFLSVLGESPSPPIQMTGKNVTSVDLREGLLSWIDTESLMSISVEGAVEQGEWLDPDSL